MRFRYEIFDRKDGEKFLTGTIEAKNRTAARKSLLDDARRDTPRRARDLGFVPPSAYRIVFTEEPR